MIDLFKYNYILKKGYYKILSILLYSWQFKKFGRNSKIIRPLQLKNAKQISIGNSVTINDMVFMMVESYKASKVVKLEIGDGCTFGHYNHIVSTNYICIGRNVLTADRVYISDNYHDYSDISRPISHQPVMSKGETLIGDDCWIGENVCIISSKIGRHCVIAANSVVNKDVPDYSIVAGAPAEIIKQYNSELKKWINVKRH